MILSNLWKLTFKFVGFQGTAQSPPNQNLNILSTTIALPVSNQGKKLINVVASLRYLLYLIELGLLAELQAFNLIDQIGYI